MYLSSVTMLAATIPTSTPHCTPLPTAPSPISSRRPRTVWSPRTLILVVLKVGGVGVQVAAPREAPAAISPMADTKPVTPAEQTWTRMGNDFVPGFTWTQKITSSSCYFGLNLYISSAFKTENIRGQQAQTKTTHQPQHQPFCPFFFQGAASTLRLKAQLDAASANLVAKLPTQAARIPPFTWQASSDSPSLGEGQVRMMAFTSSPMPTAETKASKMLKEHSWGWDIEQQSEEKIRMSLNNMSSLIGIVVPELQYVRMNMNESCDVKNS